MSISIKTIFALTSFIFFLTVPIFFYPKIINAQNVQCTGKFSNYVQSATFSDNVPLGETFPISVKFNSVADTSFKYSIKATQLGAGAIGINIGNFDVRSNVQQITDTKNPTLNFTMAGNNQDHIGTFKVSLMHSEGLGEEQVCELGTINFFDKNLNETTCNIQIPNNVKQDEKFDITLEKTDKPNIKQAIYFYRQQELNMSILPKGIAFVEIVSKDPPIQQFAPTGRVFDSGELSQNNAGSNGITIPYDNAGGKRLPGGNYIAIVEARRFLGFGQNTTGIPPIITISPTSKYFVFYCSYHPFTISSDPTSSPTDGNTITAPGGGGIVGGGQFASETCLEKAQKDPTVKCAESGGQPCDPNSPSIKTAIGCIHTNPAELAKDVLTFAIGIGGGLAFLMMILGAFQMLTSAGNPETLNAGKQRLTSAIIGLLIVIFAILLLQIIGFGILNIEGFKP